MEYIKLHECAEYRNERTKQIDYETYITTDNMLPNKGGITIAETLPNSKTVSKYIKDDILLSNIRPYFKKIWLSTRTGGCSNDVLVVKAKKGYLPTFLYYVLSDNNFFNYDTTTSKGTKMPRGTPNAIMKYLVPNYPIEKQRRIVDILSTYDSLIELNTKRIKTLEQMAENLYKEWFVRFRFPGHENAEFENGIPKNWEVKRVKEAVNRLPFGKLYKADDVQTEGSVIVIDQSMDEYVGFHSDEPSHIATVDDPIALFGDHSCKYQLMITPFSLSENVIPYKAKGNIELVYLFYALRGLVETTEYKRHWSEFTSKKILVASSSLQKEFVNKIIPMIELVEKIAALNRKLIKQRDLLLPRLMSGKLEV